MPLEVNMQFGDTSVVTQKVVKYLSIQLDCRLTFWAQLRHAATKSAKAMGILSRLMANASEPTQRKRKLIMTNTNSILLYGSELWRIVLNCKTQRKTLQGGQRAAVLRVDSAYRTVSGVAVFVISGETSWPENEWMWGNSRRNTPSLESRN